jgi:NAD(P) transhydrogenase subunit alpha
MMKIGIPKETLADETRVAAVPETVAKMVKAEMDVTVETDAGLHSYMTNSDYEKAGAHIAANAEAVFKQSDVILKVNRPLLNEDKSCPEIEWMKEASTLVAPLYAVRNRDLVSLLARKKINAFSLELLPRIARAQGMDILSSMSNLAGYKSVIMASDYLGKIFPMMTTAAGTIQSAKIIVIGAGVAGLQAIATARRLGGVVIAFDTRPAAGEQVKSLGANFVSLEVSHEQSEDTGGYAKEQSVEFYRQEQEIIHQYSKETDVIITTALIPGKNAPVLITEQMVKEMKPGSVIVDLSVEQGGNCELSEPGKIVVKHGVTIIGTQNLPATVPVNASQLYSRNLFNFLSYIAPMMKEGKLDLSDDIIKGCLVTYNGEVVHPLLKS